MHASRPRALFLLLTPANSAANRRRVDESFRHFIPPLLLRSRPHLFFTAVNTAKPSVNVVSPRNEIRNAIAVIRGEQFRVHRDQIVWYRVIHPQLIAPNIRLPSSAFPENLLAPLFPAFHWTFQSAEQVTPLYNSDNRRRPYGYRRRADTSNQSCRDRF